MKRVGRAAALGVLVCAALLSGARVRAQATSAGNPPAFDVASVKSNPARTGIRGHSFPGDRFEARNVPLRDLIIIGYGQAGQMLPDSQMTGGPGWIDTDRFDVSASVGSGGNPSVAQKQLMLQTLLAKRFQLVVHRETRDVPIYALTLARKDGRLGPKLHRVADACEPLLAGEPGPARERCVFYAPPNGVMTIRSQTMSALATVFTELLDRTVIDRTGLTGGFDGDAEYNPATLPGMSQAPGGALSSDAPSFNSALQDQLGLRLESTRGPVDVLVIDQVEHPTED